MEHKTNRNGRDELNRQSFGITKASTDEAIVKTYSAGDGELFKQRFAIICEMASMNDGADDRLVRVVASDGNLHVVVELDVLAPFIVAHKSSTIVAQDGDEVFEILFEELNRRGETKALNAWCDLVQSFRLNDCRLLEQDLRVCRRDRDSRDRREFDDFASGFVHPIEDLDDGHAIVPTSTGTATSRVSGSVADAILTVEVFDALMLLLMNEPVRGPDRLWNAIQQVQKGGAGDMRRFAWAMMDIAMCIELGSGSSSRSLDC